MTRTIKAAAASLFLIACLIITLPRPAMAADTFRRVCYIEYIKDITIDTKIHTVTRNLEGQFQNTQSRNISFHPIYHEMVWDELSASVLERRILNVSVKGDMYSAGLQDNNYVIKIGNPYITLVGEKVYVISYKQKFVR